MCRWKDGYWILFSVDFDFVSSFHVVLVYPQGPQPINLDLEYAQAKVESKSSQVQRDREQDFDFDFLYSIVYCQLTTTRKGFKALPDVQSP